jgi:hypothetical protein
MAPPHAVGEHENRQVGLRRAGHVDDAIDVRYGVTQVRQYPAVSFAEPVAAMVVGPDREPLPGQAFGESPVAIAVLAVTMDDDDLGPDIRSGPGSPVDTPAGGPGESPRG